MWRTLLLLGLLAAGVPATAETIVFSRDQLGGPPAGWVTGVTGHGRSKWTVESDPTVPDGGVVLKQSAVGDFPWCIKQGTAVRDGYVEVKFKTIAGRDDQAGGVVWRWKDGDNYYVARANALENNVSLYHTTGGRRHTIRYQAAPVAGQVWHTLRVDFAGQRIQVSLDGKRYIDATDDHITGAGAVGMWTKADSVTVFHAFSFGTRAEK
ncbi:hypothetical protein AKI39_12735 [Bordetella sp. H567]|uniref:family 16 glycoside hydrolase n=1 Tax=Bordetella sp. H567 TaxID=1697043 RepID=UPI00081CF6AA|nr:family 16 glycoside hydrolase [Bordetella sp. H567]AOB31364.1 hypothetical protein AKI39_12735 [Bordetella sp. H567]